MGRNCNQETEFLFTGLIDRQVSQIPLFLLFLAIYLISVVGNVGLIFLIWVDSRLHTPMYFFLLYLAIVDLYYSTVITPKILSDFLTDKKTISYIGCGVQIFLFDVFIVTEGFLLARMAYDRYVAISSPLLYSVIMSPKLRVWLVVSSFLIGCVNGMTQTVNMLDLSFCGSKVIDHFFCDISPLISLSESDSTINQIILLASATLFGLSSGVIVLISYIFMLSTILRIHSTEGKRKAFNTCTSHLTTVSIFYGTALFVFLKPSSKDSKPEDKWAPVFYTVVIPMLNPLIYSLRNKEVKDALRRVISKNILLHIVN
ncbi:olfactory receptor-like protein COR4 [Alligator mississippiensis]|uniref:olfactory receptor-like protein COR4 n=1 Tax=Alligator mississippiensis TaxID=8496 RepID=UPI0003D0D571|nr:olfactory receptor-like protein COR4 [Alligator mississippiensis]